MGNSQKGGPLIEMDDLCSKVSARYHRLPKKVEDDYIVEKKVLGTGMNGSVFRAKSKYSEGVHCAIKPMIMTDLNASRKADLQAEVEIFLSMDHPHVARLVDVYEDEAQNKLMLVMECCEGGELLGRVMAKKRYEETAAAHACWQVLLAMNYLHARKIVHRDVKLENFLYERKDNDHLKLIDFGFSKLTGGKQMNEAAGGTLQYAAPEVFNESFNSQCDLWSVGVIAFILLLGYMPFSPPKIQESIMQGKYPKKPEKWALISDTAKDFIESLLVVDPKKRLSAVEALKHPFIANRDQAGRTYVTPLATLTGDASVKLNVSDEILEALGSYASTCRLRRSLLSLMAWCLSQEERSEVRDAFIELDVSREGTIKFSDLVNVLTDRFQFGDQKAGQIIKGLTVKQGKCKIKGQSMVQEELHYCDFLGAMVKHHITMHEGHFLGVFRRLDKDNSGTVRIEELRKVLGLAFEDSEINAIASSLNADDQGRIAYQQFLDYLEADIDIDDKIKSEKETMQSEGKNYNGVVAAGAGAGSEKKSKTCAIL